MKKLVSLAVVLLLAAGGVQYFGYLTRVQAFAGRVDGLLEQVDPDRPETVRDSVIEAAQREGLEVRSAGVRVTVEPVEKQEAAAGLLARKGIVQTKQVRITIQARYGSALLGTVPLSGEVMRTDIRTIEVRARRVGEEIYQQMEAEEAASGGPAAAPASRPEPRGAANILRQRARDVANQR